MADEEARAALHRAQQRARCRAEDIRERQLAGSEAARADLEDRWEPLLPPFEEPDECDFDEEDDDGLG